jgi:oligoendopeptidase F
MFQKQKISPEKKRIFLDKNFDPLNQKHVKQLIAFLQSEVPNDFQSASVWYGVFHEASCAISEAHVRLELNLNLQNQNTSAEKTLAKFEEEVLSQLLSARSHLMQIYMESPWRNAMHLYDHERILQDLQVRKKYSSPDLTALQLEESKIIREYKKFTYSAQILYLGQKISVSAIVGKIHDFDKTVREAAFISYWNFIKENEEKFQDIFHRLLINRKNQANRVKIKNYTELAFCELGRIDYGPHECFILRHSITKTVIPLIEKFSHLQKKSLKTDFIAPWDISIWPDLLPQENPAKGDLHCLIDSIQKIATKIHPAFGKLFFEMHKNHLIDIAPRFGKSPGAFCVTFQESGVPFIFGNFSASLKDAMTFLHEFGHAIHGYAVSNINNILLRYPGFEFCEMASIGLELLASPFLTELWPNPKEASKAFSSHLFHMLHFWPFMAMMDEWQHAIYSTQDIPTAQERNALWLDLSQKYRPQVQWKNYEEFEALGWMSRPHIFTSPFYYIDYGIAQIGALQLWQKSKEDYNGAVNNYISGLSLGGQQSLQSLFKTVGIQFNFNEKMLKSLCLEIEKEIQKNL